MSTLVSPAISTWNIDASHSNVEFAVRHMMVATAKGRFSEIVGTVEYDGSNFAGAQIQVEIPIASIDTRQEQRDAHLRSPDFFDAENHPIATFVSKRISGNPSGEFQIVGDLTIRGITKEVVLQAESHGAVRDPWGMDRAGFSASTKINRNDFGLTWNATLETGGFVVAPEVKLTLDIEITKPGS
ncbi:MAG: YceI family protein [Gemmatimonadaceae bacterium]